MTLSPLSEDEVADAVRDAAGRRFEIVGHGTKHGLGRPSETQTVLDLSALSGIVRYEPDELVVTARAGTAVAEIETAIAAKRQRLGFAPADWGPFYGAPARQATIAGVLSADAGGSARLRFGAARDHLLGYRAVNGLGEVYKAGGHVVKNVTGFDLPKLLCGAMGTLGVLTEVTLRLLPDAPARASFVVRDVEPERGLALLRRVWSSALEPTGLAYVPAQAIAPELGDCGAGAALIRLEGAALADKRAALDALLAPDPVAPLEGGDAFFAALGDGLPFARRSGDVWRVFVPPAQAAACARELASPLWYADWAGGVIWAEAEVPEHVHSIASWAGGHAIMMRADAATRRDDRVFPLLTHTQAVLTGRIKAAFDPERLFNPGRMYEGI